MQACSYVYMILLKNPNLSSLIFFSYFIHEASILDPYIYIYIDGSNLFNLL